MATTCNRKGTVLLLKAPTDSEEDHFVEALQQAGYTAVSVSVLAFNYINEDKLKEALQKAHTFSGIVFTSPRSVQAVVQVVAPSNSRLRVKSVETSCVPSSLPCFVVGPATADAAREATFNPEGIYSGNAENLGQFILDTVSPEEKRPLLFPCAQIRRDTLVKKLQNTAYGVHEIVVYETGPSPSIMEDIARVMQSEHRPDCVVFFSPSGVQVIERCVREGIFPVDQLKVFAMGPSTQQEVVRKGYRLSGVAARPDPASLLQVLEQVQTRRQVLEQVQTRRKGNGDDELHA